MILVEHALAAELDPAWVDATVTSWTALPREARIDALRAMVAGEADGDRKAALVALGRLEQSWPSEAPPEAYPIYARELITAADGGRRSYLVAAAGFGGALDPDGRPTMTVEQARGLYAERRYALGAVAWQACAPPSGPAGTFQKAGGGGRWLVRPLDGLKEQRRLSTQIRRDGWDDGSGCRDGELDAGDGVGWTLFSGARPIVDAGELDGSPSECAPLHLRVVAPPIVQGNGSVQGGGEVLDVQMPARAQDCGGPDRWTSYAAELNARMLADLQLAAQDVADLVGAPSTLDGFRACEGKRLAEDLTWLCALR